MEKQAVEKIAISGISGFVGTNLSQYLQKDYQLVGISRRKEDVANSISYSALTPAALNSHKAVVHLAGKAHDLKNTNDDQEYFEVNTELTKRVFAAFLESDCKSFVFMSSVKAAADAVEDELSEDVVPDPKTAYGRSKRAAEEYLLEQELPPNKNIYILRPGMIHGPGNKGNLNLLYQVVKKGIPYPLGAFENKRSFVSVENLCFIIQNLIEKRPPSGIYHIADDEALSTVDLVKTIGKAAGKKPAILNIPKGGINVLAKTGDTLKLPFNTERLRKLTENYVISNAKIKKALGVDLPLKTREGLAETIRSFQESKT